MLNGYPPFCSEDPRITCSKIINRKTGLKFPDKPKISDDAKDLICRLLCDVKMRLGTRGVDEIKWAKDVHRCVSVLILLKIWCKNGGIHSMIVFGLQEAISDCNTPPTTVDAAAERLTLPPLQREYNHSGQCCRKPELCTTSQLHRPLEGWRRRSLIVLGLIGIREK